MTFRASQSASKLYTFNTSPLTALTLSSTRSIPLTIQTRRSIPYILNTRSIQKAQYSLKSQIKDKLNPEAMDAVKQTIAQNMGVGGAHTLVPEDQQFDLKDTPDLKGKVAVVTGGSDGIGYACVYTLLSKGIEKVFIISVSEDVVNNSIDTIKEEIGEEAGKKIIWLECDMADWKAVKETADKISKSTDRIDILINNAARGIMTYQLTDYGVDRHVGLHPMLARTNTNAFSDGYKPHGPRNSNLPPHAHPQENSIPLQPRPHRQHGLQRPPSHPLRHQIRIPR